MAETRKQLKERLRAQGVWDQFVRRREELKKGGMAPAQALNVAMNEIESPPLEKPDLCDRCEDFGRPRCDFCLLNGWLYYERVEMQDSDALCYWCWRAEQLGIPEAERTCPE